jgi:two-component system cell cycle sensor histidine kinase/response regulator CckA
LINVYSEPGKDTTFRIYLPVHEGQVADDRGTDAEKIPRGYGEVVLVVEDETSILQLAENVLSGLGYSVLVAKKPSKALKLAEAHAKEISLLITDVICQR